MSRSSRRGAVAQLLLAGGAVVAGLVLAAGPAQAHASFIGSDPEEGAVLEESPGEARLEFNEPVTLTDDSVQLFDAGGGELETSGSTTDTSLVVDLPAALDDGTYVVTWRVVSTDGHPIAGALTFSIGAPSETVVAPEPEEAGTSVEVAHAVVQGLTYLGLFGAAGLVLFWFVVVRGEGPAIKPRLTRAALSAAVVAGVGAFLLVPLSAAYQQASDLTDPDVWGFGRAEGAVALLVAGGLALAVAMLRKERGGPALVGGAVALGSLSVTGHTRSFGPAALVIGSDLLHVATGAVWVGGLLGLMLTLPGLPAATGGRVVSRFSALAAGLVGLVALSGTLMGWRILRSWEALLDTPFGRLLLIKVSIVAVVLAVAGWNRYRLVPALSRTDGEAHRRLHGTVRIEAAGLAVVLVLTGFLVERSPTSDESTPADQVDASTFTAIRDDLRVDVDLDPRAVGRNEVIVHLEDLEGAPVEPYAEPVLSASQGNIALGEQPLLRVGAGLFEGTLVLPRPGTWTVRVVVRLSEFESPVVDVEVPIGEVDHEGHRQP